MVLKRLSDKVTFFRLYDCSENKTAKKLVLFRVGSYAGHDTILINSSFYFIRNPTFLAAENRDFGRFVTTWYICSL